MPLPYTPYLLLLFLLTGRSRRPDDLACLKLATGPQPPCPDPIAAVSISIASTKMQSSSEEQKLFENKT
jgi:hypothetical protein